MFTLMVVVFVLGYIAIALEHPLKIDKAASALLIGTITWALYVFGGVDILSSGVSRAWNDFALHNPGSDNAEAMLHFITHHEVLHHLSEISTILFFLLGAMTIVEIVDQHQGFKIITDKITTTNKVKLLWILSILTFFMSATLDNLTTTIVIVALIRKLIDDQKDRWFFASMVVLAANAGGAWSPIGDVTTIMLWIGGQVTTMIPSLVTMLAPLVVVSFWLKGDITRPQINDSDRKEYTTPKEQLFILCLGIGALLFVPVFKTVTHLPPYLGMLFGLGIISAVASMQSAGHLDILANWLDTNIHNVYGINLVIGVLSAIVDNVPLVAAAMGMYDIAGPESVGYAAHFMQDGIFWEFLAYCAGTGGSILIIGSAAGVAAMGMEKIDFIWYVKKISLLALIGYLAGAAAFYLQATYIL